MTIIEITPNEFGAHDNNTINGANPATFPIPDGYAILPEEVGTPETLENFPFGELTVDETQTPPIVTSWTPGVVPPPEPEPEPKPSEIDVLRAEVAAMSAPLSIAIVTLAEGGQIDDVTAGEYAEMFAPWAAGVAYAAGNIRRYDDALYRCIQAHTSQEGWTPDTAASLWVKISDPAEEWPEWSQPIGAHDAYSAGDKVSHGGKHWVSDVDGNVWEPGVYGWTETK